MPRARVRGKRQITLATQHAAAKKRPSLMELAGSARGLYGRTTEERQAYLAGERKSWERVA